MTHLTIIAILIPLTAQAQVSDCPRNRLECITEDGKWQVPVLNFNDGVSHPIPLLNARPGESRIIPVPNATPAPKGLTEDEWRNAYATQRTPLAPVCAVLDQSNLIGAVFDGKQLADGSIECPRHVERGR